MDEQPYAEPTELPMFPLGSVLLPSMALPLHVFEPRFRVLVDTVLLADRPEFGVVLIERGSEVGGGDVRSRIGCVARLVEAGRHDDGRWNLLAIGTQRIEVVDWLEDDPFPMAQVRTLEDLEEPAAPDLATQLEQLETLVRRVGALAAELSLVDLPEQLVFSEDPALRVYQLATVSPLGALDRLRVLAATKLSERIALLTDLVAEQEILLEAQRGFDGP